MSGSSYKDETWSTGVSGRADIPVSLLDCASDLAGNLNAVQLESSSRGAARALGGGSDEGPQHEISRSFGDLHRLVRVLSDWMALFRFDMNEKEDDFRACVRVEAEPLSIRDDLDSDEQCETGDFGLLSQLENEPVVDLGVLGVSIEKLLSAVTVDLVEALRLIAEVLLLFDISVHFVVILRDSFANSAMERPFNCRTGISNLVRNSADVPDCRVSTA